MAFSLAFSHVGIYVVDIDRMVDFYTRVLRFVVSDRGKTIEQGIDIVFMTRDPREHHQFVVAAGRPAEEWKAEISRKIAQASERRPVKA